MSSTTDQRRRGKRRQEAICMLCWCVWESFFSFFFFSFFLFLNTLCCWCCCHWCVIFFHSFLWSIGRSHLHMYIDQYIHTTKTCDACCTCSESYKCIVALDYVSPHKYLMLISYVENAEKDQVYIFLYSNKLTHKFC